MVVNVAVIGAGAAGLVAARHLIRCGIRPAIFEASHTIGGAWSATATSSSSGSDNDVGSNTAKMWDNLTTNLSRYTCQFSEYPWDEVNIEGIGSGSISKNAFVSRDDMSAYLRSYATTMINDPTCFKLGCHVTQITPLDSNDELRDTSTSVDPFLSSYQVEWKESSSSSCATASEAGDEAKDNDVIVHKKQTFDGVIIATGFFSKPHVPPHWFGNSGNLKPSESSSTSASIQHSSQYKNPNEYINKNVVIVGSSFSSLEIATEISQTARKVTTILPHIPYVVPRYVPYKSSESESFSIAPIDLVLYQRRWIDAPQTPEQITMSKESCAKRHEFIHSLVGKRKQQEAFGSITNAQTDDKDAPPMIAISDEFLNLVISGKIEVIKGRVNTINCDDEDAPSVRIELDNGTVLGNEDPVDGFDCLIACTGYRCDTVEKLLPKEVLGVLQNDSSDSFLPIISCYDTFHPKLPGLGFVGMYRGPYMGIMELQARLLSEMMASTSDSNVERKQLLPTTDQMKQALEDSQTIREYTPRAQFPHWDYIGHIDALAKFVNVVPGSDSSKNDFGSIGNYVVPSYYQTNSDIANQVKQQINHNLENSAMERMPQLVLDAIVGHWTYDRTITQMSDKSIPQQHVSGDVFFSLKHHNAKGNSNEEETTDDIIVSAEPLAAPSGKSSRFWNTVLYREDGIFTLPNGMKMDVFREYEYQVNEDANTLEIYFVENAKRAHLFLSLKFQQQQEHRGGGSSQNVWIATSDHLCIKDLYKGEFRVTLDDGISASAITMTYRVKGPSKDYESVTNLRPRKM